MKAHQAAEPSDSTSGQASNRSARRSPRRCISPALAARMAAFATANSGAATPRRKVAASNETSTCKALLATGDPKEAGTPRSNVPQPQMQQSPSCMPERAEQRPALAPMTAPHSARSKARTEMLADDIKHVPPVIERPPSARRTPSGLNVPRLFERSCPPAQQVTPASAPSGQVISERSYSASYSVRTPSGSASVDLIRSIGREIGAELAASLRATREPTTTPRSMGRTIGREIGAEIAATLRGVPVPTTPATVIDIQTPQQHRVLSARTSKGSRALDHTTRHRCEGAAENVPLLPSAPRSDTHAPPTANPQYLTRRSVDASSFRRIALQAAYAQQLVAGSGGSGPDLTARCIAYLYAFTAGIVCGFAGYAAEYGSAATTVLTLQMMLAVAASVWPAPPAKRAMMLSLIHI